MSIYESANNRDRCTPRNELFGAVFAFLRLRVTFDLQSVVIDILRVLGQCE